jgi:hypothetical protein
MNTISSTSMTSTNGVTLISLIGAKLEARRREPRLPPAPPPPATPAPMIRSPYMRSSSWREMIAPNSSAKFSSFAAILPTSAENLL